MFPVRGPHSYGDGIGAGRNHQGQDVMARCGTPLLAARGGVVYYNSYQAGGAGNYLVINISGAGGRSHVYMHLASRSPLKVGTRVKTGQRIGVVGTTGRSTACHLHFEQWSGPGWYQGGTFLSPSSALRFWDRYS
jgi:murein DD-endopeptidase MepM/ murein hydrolase activator NlpD